jgi:hypothetical protein
MHSYFTEDFKQQFSQRPIRGTLANTTNIAISVQSLFSIPVKGNDKGFYIFYTNLRSVLNNCSNIAL